METPEDDVVDKSNDSIRDRMLVYAVPADSMVTKESAEIDIATLIQIIWGRKLVILGIVAIFAAASLVLAVFSTEWYLSDTLLAPAESQSDRSRVAGSLGGLAGLAGISIEDDQSAESIAILKSRDFTRSFIKKHNLLPVLFSDEWDAATGKWREEDSAKRSDIRDAIAFFDEDIRSVSQNSENGLVTLSVTWTDPQLAADWVNGMVTALNEQMRQRALTEAEFNIEFLEEQLSQTSMAILQQSLANVLEGELERLMLAKGDKEYAFRQLDTPQVSKRPDRPKRALILLVGTILGGICAIFYTLLEFALKRQSAEISSA